MQHIRLIQSIKWHQEGDKLLLFLWQQKITFPNTLGLSELFCEMQSWQKDYTREVLIEKYKLSSRVVDLLIKLWVFICLENCAGPEARYFHAFVENPSSAYLPEQQEEKFIASLYQNLEHFFSESLWEVKWWKLLPFSKSFDLNFSLHPTHSTRKKIGEQRLSHQKEILQMITTLCSSYQDEHYYGSWGGLYSLYPVLIFKNDEVYVFDRYQECFYQNVIPWLHKELVSSFIATEQNYFEVYECYVVFLSAYQATLSKYSNRGYKYIQMEAGALATLIRQYTANLNIPQLEIQGYFDQVLMSILEQKLGINKEKTLLVHTMCLN